MTSSSRFQSHHSFGQPTHRRTGFVARGHYDLPRDHALPATADAFRRGRRVKDRGGDSKEAGPFARDSPTDDNLGGRSMGLDTWLLPGLLVCLAGAIYVSRKVLTVLLTLPAVALVPAASRRLSHWVRARDYAEDEFLQADGAGERWVQRRREALTRLASTFHEQHAQSIAWGTAIRESFSDLRFTDACRVPFPFAPGHPRQVQRLLGRHGVAGPEAAGSRWELDARRQRRVWRECRRLRSLQGVDSEGVGPCQGSRPGARTPASGGRREHREAEEPCRAWTKCPSI